MKDRELLILAAKAAGINLAGGVDEHGAYEENWNPLADDAAALRLAVKLDISVGKSVKFEEANVACVRYGLPMILVQESWENDKYAATRRAIVRVAAAIGEKMP